jgi:hypothetical protein
VAGRNDETDHLATVQGLPFRFVFALRSSIVAPTDLPVGSFWKQPVQPHLQKYSGFPKNQITLLTALSRPIQRGVSRSSRTLVRDAMDASGAKDESAFLRTEKSCGPAASMLASSWRE